MPSTELTAAWPGRADVASVETRIRPYIRQTPAVTIDRAELGLAPGPLTLKLEQLQHSGSFKARGAFANLLLRDLPAAGVAAASGGNHGAAVAYAAGVLGIPARIFVPEVSSAAKVARIREYGAGLVIEGATYSEALVACERWAAASGALTIHAFDQPQTVLGAGTLALELQRQVPQASAVLAAVGGGGLLAGLCAGYRDAGGAGRNAGGTGRNAGGTGRVRVTGAEPEGAPSMTQALAAGRPAPAPAGSVAVDSLAPRQAGQLTFAVVSALAAQVVLVSDEAILAAQRLLWDRLRVVAEPGGCAALAALACGRYQPDPGEHVAVVISGANTIAVDFGR